jgi:hypothetical protein
MDKGLIVAQSDLDTVRNSLVRLTHWAIAQFELQPVRNDFSAVWFSWPLLLLRMWLGISWPIL